MSRTAHLAAWTALLISLPTTGLAESIGLTPAPMRVSSGGEVLGRTCLEVACQGVSTCINTQTGARCEALKLFEVEPASRTVPLGSIPVRAGCEVTLCAHPARCIEATEGAMCVVMQPLFSLD